jgi:hypothetical protein
MKIPMKVCRKRLTVVWFTGAGIVCAIFFGQTIGNRYLDHVSEAWGWLLPAIMPSLSLMVYVWSRAATIETDAHRVDRFVFRLAMTLSVCYLLVLIVTILVQPIVAPTATEALQLMNKSSLFAGPLQGLAAASLGAFFFRKNSEPEEPEREC